MFNRFQDYLIEQWICAKVKLNHCNTIEMESRWKSSKYNYKCSPYELATLFDCICLRCFFLLLLLLYIITFSLCTMSTFSFNECYKYGLWQFFGNRCVHNNKIRFNHLFTWSEIVMESNNLLNLLKLEKIREIYGTM